MIETMETIHIYYEYNEGKPPKDRAWVIGLIFSLLYLAGLIAWIWFVSLPTPPTTIRVPAKFISKSFTAIVPIIPTGVKTYLPTSATGIITIYNGSILSRELPKGFILTGKDGVEIITDGSAFVPAGNAPSYGVASVTAHAVVAGTIGNIRPFDIYQVYGDSLYIRNLTAFSGGRNRISVSFVTSQDRDIAHEKARFIIQPLSDKTPLKTNCRESAKGIKSLTLTWVCTYATYMVPKGVIVLSAQVLGNEVVLTVRIVMHLRRSSVLWTNK